MSDSMRDKQLECVSLGAGVQSSAMLLMGLDGYFGDPPDYAIFADTGWEPKAVYAWLDRLEAAVAPFPIIRVTGSNIRNNAAPRQTNGRSFVTLPTYLEGGGMGRRQCTHEYKLKPMQRLLRSLGATAKNPIKCWIGISTDEVIRAKPSRVKYAINRFPLLDAGVSRQDCVDYLRKQMGEVAPKSSCIGCPFHSDDYWLRLRHESPDEFSDACAFDEEIRNIAGMGLRQYLHRSCRPLHSIEFRHEKQGRMFEDAFGSECEGICGT